MIINTKKTCFFGRIHVKNALVKNLEVTFMTIDFEGEFLPYVTFEGEFIPYIRM